MAGREQWSDETLTVERKMTETQGIGVLRVPSNSVVPKVGHMPAGGAI